MSLVKLTITRKRFTKMEAYKIYIDGLLWGVFEGQYEWKAVIQELEDDLKVECNAVGSRLQTNVKHK